MGKSGGFRTLEAWIEARAFRQEVTEIAKAFPSFEQYALTKQVVNSARSVHANIAEGYGRFHYKETTKHCRIARGSLEETLDHLITALDDKYITQEKLSEMELKYERCHKLLNGYISYIERMDKNKVKKPDKPPES